MPEKTGGSFGAGSSDAGSTLRPAGFFVLRTPLLPFDEFRDWSDGLQAPGALGADRQLEAALANDRKMLADRLLAAWLRPEVREAVFLASPELDAALERSSSGDANSEASAKALRSLVAYFARMTARSTPFGLFAGCSVGSLDQHTRLDLVRRSDYRRHTRLDMDYLTALVTVLEADAAVRRGLRYEPNSSLYRAGGRLHYAESRMDKAGRSYHLVALEDTLELSSTLERASGGASLEDLATALIDDTVSPAAAGEFIEDLVNNQVLVSDLGLHVTGEEAIHGLIKRLNTHAETQPVAEHLERVRDDLECIDRDGVGGTPPERYNQLRAALESLPAHAEPARLFQADMVKPAEELSLGEPVLGELARGLALLKRIGPAGQGGTALRAFTERFVARYEEAEVPLVEVLDEEIGIGFAAAPEPGGEPLLRGLDRPPSTPQPDAWRARDAYLLRRLLDITRRGEQELVLDASDLDALAGPETAQRLPFALEVFARLAATSVEALERGEFRLWLQSASGPSGAKLLGRFCHADPELHRRVEELLRAEEASRPEAVFAEIVHLPEGRLGNILSRPVLRTYEIAYMGRSGAARDQQIPISDLVVSVRHGRTVLRSVRLDREVVPRLTAAHNFTLRSLGAYRFLCALQQQGTTSGLGWSWGPLISAPFLPRVVNGRLVLARAYWNVDGSELKPVQHARGTVQFAAVQEWRRASGLPRYVALADADNEFLIDFDNVLCVEAFLHRVKSRLQARLVELFPPPDELCVAGPEGRFTHELIVPFVQSNETVRTASHSSAAPVTAVEPRRFAPGSEWLYVKLYTGAAVADRILVDQVGPAVESALGAGAADSWFFLRYSDPDYHLRLRLHGDPRRLAAEVLPNLTQTFDPLVKDGRIARWQVDTYVREVERYGGDEGILVAERLFGLDSACVLKILESLSGDEGLQWRWKLALCGVDLLLDVLGLGLEQKRDWARARRDAFALEFRADSRLRQQLGDKYRSERRALDDLLRLARTPEAAQYPALRALRSRTDALLSVARRLEDLERAGQLDVSIPDLAASYAHMHVNRLLRSAHRFQELVVYDLLDRMYRAQLAIAEG